MAKIAYQLKKIDKVIKELIERHNRVKIVFANAEHDGHGGVMISGDMRKRVITKNGKCEVSYKSEGYKNWSGYSQSCFTQETDIKDYKKTIRLMRKHDGTWLIPVEAQYGWFFKKKVKLYE
jgi:hypothetical protein